MANKFNYDHYKTVPDPAEKVNFKKKKPKLIAVVDEDNCTGCQVCVPFCPVDCIEPTPIEKYGIPIPTEVLNSKNGPLNDLVAQREQLIKEYNAKDRGSSWFLKYYGADLETGIYLWHPFHKID